MFYTLLFKLRASFVSIITMNFCSSSTFGEESAKRKMYIINIMFIIYLIY